MPCRRVVVGALCAGAMLMALSPSALAQNTPEVVVAEIYKVQDAGEESPIYEPELMDRFLTPDLIALINEDLDRAQGRIDFDPFYDADDADDIEVTDFAVATQSARGNEAVVLVTFKNFGKPSSITFDLVRDGGQWKVNNIRSARWDLLRLLK
jgi:hypothetical protein